MTHSTTRLIAIAFSALTTLTGCGDDAGSSDPFVGSFTGTYQGAALRVETTREGDTLRLELSTAAQRQSLEATIADGVATGTFTDPQIAGEGKIRVEPTDANGLRLTLIAKNAFGVEQKIPFELRRASKPTSDAAGSRDTNLIGTWRKSESYTSGPDFSMASDTFMTLRADGTFRHGDSRVAGGNGSVSARSGAGDAVEGQWRSGDSQIYARASNDNPWQSVGRYYIENGRMLVTLPNGEREVWQRVR